MVFVSSVPLPPLSLLCVHIYIAESTSYLLITYVHKYTFIIILYMLYE